MAQQDPVDLPGEFDALLRQAMSAEPSAEFLPRVRQRLADTRPRAFPVWTATGLTAAAAAVLLLTLWPATRPEPVRVRSVPGVAAAERPAAQPVAAGLDAPQPRKTQLRAARQGRAAPRARASGPVVIVDPQQHAAIVSVMRLVSAGALTTDSFAQTAPLSLEAIRERVMPVSVPAVEVSPIAVGGVLQIETEK